MTLDDEFNARFANWVHWCRMKGLHQERAGSAEGAYRSPQHWEPMNPKPEWLLVMNVPDAVLVNRAFSQLGGFSRRVIKVLWFRPSWKPQYQAQKLNCHYRDLGEVGYRAKQMLRNRLRFMESRAKIETRSPGKYGEHTVEAA